MNAARRCEGHAGGVAVVTSSPLIEQPRAHRGKDHADDEPRATLRIRRATSASDRKREKDDRQSAEDVLGGHGHTICARSFC